MTLDLSGAALLNAAGAFLFALVGAFILVVGRTTRLGWSVGTLSCAFGLLFVAENLLLADTLAGAVASTLPAIAAAGAGIVAAFHLGPSSPRERRVLVAYVTGCGVAWALVTSGLLHDALVLRRGPFPGPPVPVAVAVGAILAAVLAMNAVVFACARSFRASGAQEGRARRAFAAVAVAFDVYVLFAVAAVLAPGWNGSTVPFAAGTGLLVVLTVGAAVAFVPGRATHDARLASRLVATFAASAVAGGVFWLVPGGEGREFGAFGIVRTIGAALLVLAIVRYDLLGVPLPRLAVSRGPLAAGALAILFVVAQVAQNFLAAQYGLLMGGVVAGAFLFAASPIQRAFEGGRRDRAVAAAAVPDDAALEAYRAAVRAALADGAMTREEEEHLADVAHHLKLSPRDALRVRREVEDARTRSSL